MSKIRVENLTKVFQINTHRNLIKRIFFPKYQKFKAVDSISFEIEKGEVFGLLGPNGAGKTTTILMLCGLEYPTSGIIYIDDLNINIVENYNKINGKFNAVFSDKLLYNRMTAYDNLVFYANLYLVEDPEKKVEELLKLLNLTPWKDQYVENFSLGMRMKLALARALINDPEILYLDEPTLGLDVKNSEFVRNFLKNLNCTILLCTHYLNEAIMLCARIGILRKGKLRYLGTPTELKKLHISHRFFTLETNDNQSVKNILKKNPFVINIFEKNLKLEIEVGECDNYFKILNDIKEYKLYQFQELKTGLEGLFFDVDEE